MVSIYFITFITRDRSKEIRRILKNDVSEDRKVDHRGSQKEDSNLEMVDDVTKLLHSITRNHKEEIDFLREEIRNKNDLISTLQVTIQLLVSDHNSGGVTSASHGVAHNATRKQRLPQEAESRSQMRQEINETEDEETRNVRRLVPPTNHNPQLRRVPVTTKKNLEKNQHNYNTQRNGVSDEQNERPLILLVGDSTLKHVTSFDLKKNCRGASIMVRSIQGSKIKNIKNLVIDCLEDVKPAAICLHVCTNDIGAGRSIDQILNEMEELVSMIQRQGILAIVSLVTVRDDKFSEKVELVNERLRALRDRLRAGCVEHDDIREEHLNTSGLHIARQHNYIFNNNFSKYFTYIISNNFWAR